MGAIGLAVTAPIAVATPTTDPPAQRPTAVQQEPSSDTAYADPSRSLGATSPSCRYALSAGARRSCRQSGSVAQPHPLSAYGLDVRIGFSLTDPGKTFMSALQSLGAAAWMALLYVMRATLLLLEWSFSLDLTNQAMPEVRRQLARLHGQAFGDPWLVLAITLTGLWGMWRGLVQRRTSETLAGLAATVALMIVALVLIARPAETVGRAAQLSNDAGISVLGAATTGDPAQSRDALASSLAGVFAATVRDPWCAMQFGSVDYCDQRTGDPSRPTNAELWLEYPAQSWQRGRLHDLVKGDAGGRFSPFGAAKDLLGFGDHRQLPDDVSRLARKAPERVRLQDAGGTFPRLALLAIVSVGFLGAIVLFTYLGVRLLLAAGLGLVLLLLAPAMLLAPALGDSGRATFIAWGRRLLGAILAKLIYAIFLAVVLAAGQTFSHLDIGWFGTWLLLGAFWWGVFLKRHEIVGFVSAGAPHNEGRSLGQALGHGYYAWMLGRGLGHAAGRGLDPARAAGASMRARRSEAAAARTAATRGLAREKLDEHAREVLLTDHDSARDVVARRDVLKQELFAVDRRLRGFDEATVAARAAGAKPPLPTAEQQHLLRHREELQTLLADPALRRAEHVVRHAERNEALTGDPVTRRDLDVYHAARAKYLNNGMPPSDPQSLRAAGIDPQDYQRAPEDRKERFREQVERYLARERDLLRAAGNGKPVPDHDVAGAREWLDPSEVRARTSEERARLRAERRQRRGLRDGSYRVR